MQTLRLSVWVMASFGALVFVGCAQFHAQPVSAEKSVADFNARSLADEGLRAYLATNGIHGAWPRQTWDFNTLTLVAFYYQPSLDVARAQWSVATAGTIAAGERPNPVLSVASGYNATTDIPSPWIVAPLLDIPIETAGKRGYRVAQAQQLVEVARLNVASVAWRVRSAVRRSLVELDAAQTSEALLEAQLKIQTNYVALVESQLRAGAVSPYEVTQARVALNQTRFGLYDAAQQSAAARVQLAGAVGVPPVALEGIELNFGESRDLPPALPDGEARRQALLNRADILGALAEYAAAQSALQLEIARQYPDLHLSPGYDYDQGDNKWSLGLSVTLPAFNHNQGAIAVAEARRAESAANFNALQARVVSEIERAVTGYRIAVQKTVAAAALHEEQKAQLRVAQAMLEAGDISRVELAQQQLELNDAALRQHTALVSARKARGELEDVLQSSGVLTAATELAPRTSTHIQP